MLPNPLIGLTNKRPRSCGRVSSEAYFHWKIYQSQLWRFPEHQVGYAPPIKLEPLQPQPQHHRPPRKGDAIFQDGFYVGYIIYTTSDEVVTNMKRAFDKMDFVCRRTRGRQTTWYLD